MSLIDAVVRYQNAVASLLAMLPPGTAPAELVLLNYELSAELAKAGAQ